MPEQHCFHYYSFIEGMRWGSVCPPTLFFFKIVLAIWDPLRVHVNFRLEISISGKNTFGIFIGTALDLAITLGGVRILTLSLSLSLHEHGMSFHVHMSPSEFPTKYYSVL